MPLFRTLFDLAQQTCHFFDCSAPEIFCSGVVIGYYLGYKCSDLCLGLVFGLSFLAGGFLWFILGMLNDNFSGPFLNKVPRNRSFSLERKAIRILFNLKLNKTFFSLLQ